jgi:hypothetical protein
MGALIVAPTMGAEPVVSPQRVLMVGAVSEFGTLDGVEFESCAVTPFLDNQRIYLCYRKRVKGDLVVGENMLGRSEPVTAASPETVLSKIVFQLENSEDPNKRLFYEFPKETYRDLASFRLGPNFSGPGRETHLAVVLQSETLTVFMAGSDGGESYRVNWIINAKDHKVRRVDSSREGSEVFRTGPWLEMKEIPKPKIVLQIKK